VTVSESILLKSSYIPMSKNSSMHHLLLTRVSWDILEIRKHRSELIRAMEGRYMTVVLLLTR
jgi:hypothetical protein